MPNSNSSTREESRTPDYARVLVDLNRLPERAARNLKSAFAIITERAAETLKVSRANVWLFTDATRKTLRCIDSYDLSANEHSNDTTMAAESFPDYIQALMSERVIVAADAARDPRTREFALEYLPGNNIKSLLDAPIRQDGEVVGVICLEQVGQIRHWTEDEAAFVGTLSDFATIALLSHHKEQVESALVQAQRTESLGRLAGGIAHDFNNTLTIIMGAVETLRQMPTHREPNEENLLNLIADAGDRARNLTRNLLALGGQQVLHFRALSTWSLLDAMERLTSTIIRENVHAEFVKGDVEYWLNGDQTQLEQVLLNHMMNSVDAMPDGGDLKVEILAPDNNGQIGFAIVDTGCGIVETDRERMFDPFFTTKGSLGSGLGLSVSLGVVQQHGGNLTCAYSNSEGTRFEMRFGQTEAPAASTPAQPAPASVQPEHQYRLLLVEDEPSVREIVAQMLDTMGYQTRVAENALHALALLEEEQVDLLISDVLMPDMRGPDLYQAALEQQPGLRALFVSGYSEEVISELVSGTERVGYLSKPFTLKKLRRAIELVIEGPPKEV